MALRNLIAALAAVILTATPAFARGGGGGGHGGGGGFHGGDSDGLGRRGWAQRAAWEAFKKSEA